MAGRRGWIGVALCGAVVVAAATAGERGLQVARPALHGDGGRELAAALEGSGLLDKVSHAVNTRVALPRAVRLRLADCEAPNAWYLPERHEVQLCLQLAERVADLLAGQVEDEEQLLRAVDGSLRFILLHEVGHALVDVLQLAVTGREEDAVDQLAVWLLLEQADGAEAVLSAASVFAGNASGGTDLAAAHALDAQRYFNMVCWVYGSAPERHAELPADWGLPPERAAGCAEEYRQLRAAWTRLLAAHAPPPPATANANPATATPAERVGKAKPDAAVGKAEAEKAVVESAAGKDVDKAAAAAPAAAAAQQADGEPATEVAPTPPP
jgi:hypothetical protein